MKATGRDSKRLKEQEAEEAIARAYESDYDDRVVELRPSMSLRDRVTIYVTNLVIQGKSMAEAMDHARHYFGLTCGEVERLLEPDPDLVA